ncbi:DNA-binding transcription factor [Lithospermum erythrorhizon]|uniref:DNA-binding transcription factor n=1 Tax=Lithospermum erythrorhizon TaxID=34254 RepID=A0AAV3RZV5_LITER
MASQGVGEAVISGSGPSHHHPHHTIPYSLFHGLNSPNLSYINNEESTSFEFGELEEAIVLQDAKINNHDESKPSLYTARPAATLEMFPSWPTKFQLIPRGSNSRSGEENTDSGSAMNALSSRGEAPASPISRKAISENQAGFDQKQHLQSLLQKQLEMASDGTRTNLSQYQATSSKSTQEKKKGVGSSERVLDAKTLRRLAQNREAARKSRLRKKAYVQQLESSRIRLSQLEQELQLARSQGYFLGGGGNAGGNMSSGAAIFDMEYARWLEDDHRHMSELRAALQAQLSDADLRFIVDGYVAHYDELFRIKGVAAKTDIFHLINGMWTTPAERCFLWMGGFKPSELIKMLISQLDPLTEQQLMGIYSLQHSSQQAEEALSQGLDQLQQSLVDSIICGTINDGMHHMAIALGKLGNLEGFVRQADNLRQQTLHQLQRILTVRQATRCFLVIGEFYGRLRALSSLWASRPEGMILFTLMRNPLPTTAASPPSNFQQKFTIPSISKKLSHFTNFDQTL